MKSLFRGALALGIGIFAMGATPNWNAQVEKTDGGHRLGNPDAKVKLIEFVSYTCPHCAHFEQESEGSLKLEYVRTGNVSVEVRHALRDPIDLTVATLTNCGAPEKFFGNHTAFMLGQDKWIKPLVTANKAQRDRWNTGTAAQRRRAIASDFGLYAIMLTRGYTRTQVDQCLNDDAKAKAIVDASAADDRKYGLESTPSFAINGLLLLATHDWSFLRPQIDARL